VENSYQVIRMLVAYIS